MKKLRFIFLIVIAFLMQTSISIAQCSMCKAVAENNTENNENFGEQLNFGIVFLMAIPYLFILIIPLIIFRKKIAEFIRELRGVYKD